MPRHAAIGWGLIALLAAGALLAAEEPQRMKPGDVLVTIYTPRVVRGRWDNETRERVAVVKECRTIPFPAGTSEYRFTDVAEDIRAATVRFTDLTDPQGTRVLEQNYHYDLVDAEALLKRFIERPIELVDGRGKTHSGTLLSRGHPLILRRRRGSIEIIGYQGQPYTFYLSEVPKDLVTRPALVWKVRARKAGDHDVVVSYQTGGLSWHSDYSATVNADDSAIDLSGWVTISNTCGTRFPNARVKLFAGDVRSSDARAVDRRRGGFSDEPDAEERKIPGSSTLFEYPLFALQERTTIENNQTKQVELVTARNVPVKKVYTYDGLLDRPWWEMRWHNRRDESYGTRCRTAVRVNLEFENRVASNLGMPLPAGIVRAYKRDDADGALEFIGEDRIGHTPRSEKLRVYFGDAFDIVGERTRKEFRNPERYQIRESFEIELRNHKKTPVTVYALEHLYRSVNWKIEKSSIPYKKLDSANIEFPVTVPANGKTTLTYTVFYWWR